MRKIILYLFVPIFLLLSCKSESSSYNDVVKEASERIEAKSELDTLKEEISNEPLINEEVNYEKTVEDSIPILAKDPEKEAIVKNISEPKKASNSQKGIMTFDDFVHEFGTISEGDIIKHEFYFTNTGTGVINVKNASATCGCTIPSYPFIPINPGERGFIGVTYNSVGKLGVQTPVITVVSDSKEKITKLKLTGEVLSKSEESSEKTDTTGLSQ